MQGVFDSNLGGIPAATAKGTNGAVGVQASSDTGTAVQATGRIAISAGSTNGVGLAATNIGQGIGVRATSDNGWGVNAQSVDGVGVLGASDNSVGVQGICQKGYNYGVSGTGPNAGVAAFNPNNNHAAYLASEFGAAWLTGDVHISGKVNKGGGGFKIDHPLDPENSFLSHSFVESPDMKNFYDGVIIIDEQGDAEVTLPNWFTKVNRDFRYQLTPLLNKAPDLFISQEVTAGKFRISGGKPGLKVCWQVTGIRCDAWAESNRIVVEESKTKEERGNFLHPSLYNFGNEKDIGYLKHEKATNNSAVHKQAE